jgi:hypothetical protein
MRQILSTALVACIVGALAGATMGTVAQAPAEPPVSATALNADRVDGLSAVKATTKKARRKNKLVATDAKGFLPSNIVKAKWGLIADKPAFLADDIIGWNEVQGIPAGFADGVDDSGVTGLRVKLLSTIGNVPAGVGSTTIYSPPCPAGSVVVGGGHDLGGGIIWNEISYPYGDRWRATFYNTMAGVSADATVGVLCLSTEPAGAITTAKKSMRGAKKRN